MSPHVRACSAARWWGCRALACIAAHHAHAAAVAQAQDGPVFNRDIAPIVHQHCAECHRPGGVAPFSLVMYEEVKKRDRQIVEVIGSGFMPPWLPEPQSGRVALQGERRLSDEQIRTIQQWVAGGSPQGDGTAPQAVDFDKQWKLGKPDLIASIPEAYIAPADTADTIRTFVMPISIAQPQYLKAIDLRCENPKVIHHALFSIDITGQARMMDASDDVPGYPSMGDLGLNLAGSFGAWSPGAARIALPGGVARLLPKQCDLVVEVHLRPTGKQETVKPEVALYFADDSEHIATALSLGSFWVDIPENETHYVVRDEVVMPVDVRLIGLTPHAHYICKQMRVDAIIPGGERLPLLRINDWDFNWLQEYRYEQPLDLPAGTSIEMEFLYDNSADNLRNPHHPPRRVQSGGRATDEMALLLLTLTARDERDRGVLEQAHTTMLLERMKRAKAARDQ